MSNMRGFVAQMAPGTPGASKYLVRRPGKASIITGRMTERPLFFNLHMEVEDALAEAHIDGHIWHVSTTSNTSNTSKVGQVTIIQSWPVRALALDLAMRWLARVRHLLPVLPTTTEHAAWEGHMPGLRNLATPSFAIAEARTAAILVAATILTPKHGVGNFPGIRSAAGDALEYHRSGM